MVVVVVVVVGGTVVVVVGGTATVVVGAVGVVGGTVVVVELVDVGEDAVVDVVGGWLVVGTEAAGDGPSFARG